MATLKIKPSSRPDLRAILKTNTRTRGNKKELGRIFLPYFERNRKEMKKDPAVQKPTGLCFDYDSFVNNGKIFFVFEGGGFKGYVHLGAYIAMLEQGLLPENTQFEFYGTSAGAIAAVVTSLITQEKISLQEAFRKFTIHPAYLVFFLNLGYNPFNGRLIRWRINNILKKKGIKSLTELRTAITAVLYDVQEKDSYLAVFGPEPFADVPFEKVDPWRFGKGLSIGGIVQSSCAMPGLFTAGVPYNIKLKILKPRPPYEKRIPLGKKVLAEPGPPGTLLDHDLRGIGLLTDGGTKANLPLIVALSTPRYRKESDIVYAVNIEVEKKESRLAEVLDKLRYSNPKTRVVRFLKNMADASIQQLYLLDIRNNLFSTMKRTIDSMMEEISERGNALCMHGNVVMFNITVPNVPLWRPDKAGELVLAGYEQTKQQIIGLKKLAGLI